MDEKEILIQLRTMLDLVELGKEIKDNEDLHWQIRQKGERLVHYYNEQILSFCLRFI